MEAKFYNKNGTLTAYAFACGYVETKGNYRLYRDGCFHVQGEGIWLTFGSLTLARRELNRLGKHAHEWETAYDNSEAVAGAYCLVPKCELFIRANDYEGAI
jgi:hypothetical protein